MNQSSVLLMDIYAVHGLASLETIFKWQEAARQAWQTQTDCEGKMGMFDGGYCLEDL